MEGRRARKPVQGGAHDAVPQQQQRLPRLLPATRRRSPEQTRNRQSLLPQTAFGLLVSGRSGMRTQMDVRTCKELQANPATALSMADANVLWG